MLLSKRRVLYSVAGLVIFLFFVTWNLNLLSRGDEHLKSYGIKGRMMKGGPPPVCYHGIDPVYYKTDVNSLIKISNPEDIARKRNYLVQSIWKSQGFPHTKLPGVVKNNVTSPLPDMDGLGGVDKLDISMVEGRFKSTVYFFRPRFSTGHLVIFHQGHSSNLAAHGGRNTIEFFLTKGFSVLALYMPLYGPNTRAPFANHDQLGLLQSDTFSPLQLFLEPVAVSLNYVRKNYTFKDTTMIGVSGGGWTTTLYAAIDPSIQQSYPVAGTLPLYLTSWPCAERRCWEDARAQIYSKIDYTELYLLGSYGEGRRQIQILNQFDSCCFYGIGYKTYEEIVRSRLSEIGPGQYKVFLDTSFRKDHKISEHALNSVAVPRFWKRKIREEGTEPVMKL